METSLVSAFVASKTAQLQLAAAAKMMRMNAQNEAAILKVIEAAQDNMRRATDAAAGLGRNLDVVV